MQIFSTFFFDPLQIFTANRIQFDFMAALSFLGSNMGLFLGLGVLQFIELFYSRAKLLLK